MTLPDPSPLAVSYYQSGILLWAFFLAWSIFLPALFLVSGWGKRLRAFTIRGGRSWFSALFLYNFGFQLYFFLGHIPLFFYSGYVRQHAYGLSNQTFQKWGADELKYFAIDLIVSSLLLWLPYLCLRRFPRRWWLLTGLGSVPYFFVTMLVAPIWIAPLFNHYGPMKDQVLEGQITSLAARAGIGSTRIFEVDKSVDTKTTNAFVTGFLGTKRIVLWDTLLAKLDRREVLHVVGHEMGHYVLGHLFWGLLFYSSLTLLGLWLVHLTSHRLLRRYGPSWGFTVLSDIGSLPLLFALLQLYAFLLSPVGLAFSRWEEHEADRFSLELTRDNDAALTTEIKMGKTNLSYPHPGTLVKWLRYTHPTPAERFEFAQTYRPWETGQPLYYGDRFQN